MRKSDAMFRLKCCRNQLTRQQTKTIYGQIASGQNEAAMKGLDRSLKKQERGCNRRVNDATDCCAKMDEQKED